MLADPTCRIKKMMRLVIYASIQFIILTFIAMLFYPGSNWIDKTTTSYSFINNFFSDLGLTKTYSGQSNIASSVLFFIALFSAGAGMTLFFIAFPAFFKSKIISKSLSLLGSFFGILTGLCFITVAATPANLYGYIHGISALWAFKFFPICAILYTAAILTGKDLPKKYSLVFAIFAVLLVGYLILVLKGPSMWTPRGWTIQATGQKIIVYSTLISVWILANGALKNLEKSQ